ncbi:MAG: glutamate ligase domain-containing protein, partial [Flavobacteriaceae bacterium]
PDNHRSQLMLKNNKTIVLDAYNANPTSMHAAVHAFSLRKGTKAVILGYMAELGSHEADEHKALVELVKSLDIDACYWVGEAFKPFVNTNYFETTEAFALHLKSNPIDADQILVKGSRSVGLEKLITFL